MLWSVGARFAKIVHVKVRVADTDALGRLLRERMGSIETVRSTRTTIVLETVKETTALDLSAMQESEAVDAGGA